MKFLRSFCLLLTFALMLGVMMPAYADPHHANSCQTLDATAPLGGNEKLLETAKAALLYELSSDTLVYAWNLDEQLDPSGMNKIMTALLALETTDPDTIVTVTRTALNSVAIGSVSAGLKRGEEITMRDLLYCMIVGSANDAAAVIAEFVGSTQEQFVEMMNTRAAELGCQNTHFTNPSGISQNGQYSTARDLAKITVAALKNELFAQMFRAERYTVAATNKVAERQILTTNYLMSKEKVKNQFDSRVTGGKTGALSTTDRSVICTSEYDGKQYLSVVMSAKGEVSEDGLSVKKFGSFEETRVLLDHGFKSYSVCQVLHEGQTLGQFEVSGGENRVVAGPAHTVKVTLPDGILPDDVSYQCVLQSDLTAPITVGQTVGSVQVWYRNICIAQSELVAMHDVRETGSHMTALVPSAQQPADQELLDWLVLGVIILAVISALTVTVLLVTRLIRKRQIRRRHKLINGGKP